MTRDAEQAFVALDLETTGLLAAVDRIVEFGAVRFDRRGVELGRFAQLVHPERPMSPSAQAVHGISDADLAGAPTARQVLPAFLDFLGAPGNSVMLAHNACFDAGFLGRELARAGIVRPGYAVVDTLALARRKRPELVSHRLDVLARVYGLDPAGTHRALGDSLRVKDLWLALGGPDEAEADLVAYPFYDATQTVYAPVGWDALADAIARGQRVRMQYHGGTRGDAAREVTPRAIIQRGGVTFLVALCHIDSFEKSFRLDRVRSYEVVENEPIGVRG
jgi:DNA polymerase III subunit epsilon